MATYGNPHTLPPAQCAANTVTFTDSTLTANTIKTRTVHISELRTAIDAELSRRGLSTTSWTDSTLTANVTVVRKTHIDELRTALNTIHIGDCSSDSYYCPQDALACVDVTDSTITANSTKIRNLHISEIRTKLNTLRGSCICEAEQCEYCADCGYYYQTCSHAGVACNDHKYSECHHSAINNYQCASTNLATGTSHPYRASNCSAHVLQGPADARWGAPLYWYDTSCVYATYAWNGTVPWAMCNYAPPGSNWGSCEYQSGHNHTSDWSCKCNPFTWS